MTNGKVWLVGAGPGDIGLFTIKGMEILKNAEVVVYDSLVGQGVLSQIPPHARLINVETCQPSHYGTGKNKSGTSCRSTEGIPSGTFKRRGSIPFWTWRRGT